MNEKSKSFLFLLGLLLSGFINVYGGEIKIGSTPNTIIYQGRVEKDNAPLNGIVYIKFRICNAPVGGTCFEFKETTTTARAGIFSVAITTDNLSNILGRGENLYLETIIENEVLSPREPIGSVLYSIVAKKLEDGAVVHFSSITVGNNPNIINTTTTHRAIILDGGIYTDIVCFSRTGTCIEGAGVAVSTISGISAPATAYITADSGNSGSGDILLRIANSPKVILTHDGNFGIGTLIPQEKLQVAGNVLVSSSVIINEGLKLGGVFNDGVLKGLNNEQISIGVNNDRIDFLINGSTRVTINNTRFGIGNENPSKELDVNGDISAKSIEISTVILKGEIYSETGKDLVLQKTNNLNVGIGTDTPKAKLHVDGTIIAEKAIVASSATILNDLEVMGNLDVSNYGSIIKLSSTTIYGTLDVKGSFTINNDNIAALASTQTFTGKNTFTSEVKFSSDVYITIPSGKLVIGSDNSSYSQTPSLQIGNPSIASSSATLYISAGSDPNYNSRIDFYKGPNKIVSLGTDNNTFKLFYGNITRINIDDNAFRIYNSSFIVSPQSNDLTPAIYVSSNSWVGIGTTTVSHPLTVSGSIRITGSGNGLVFSDGSTLFSASGGLSVGSISNSTDAIILADSDNNGSGSIILKVNNNEALRIDNSGKVGIGTLFPQQKLHVVGGNIVVGNPVVPSGTNESIIVGGNLMVDGTLKQRSSSPVEFKTLFVEENVYLSTNTAGKTGIGTDNPTSKLDILNGSITVRGANSGISVVGGSVTANGFIGSGSQITNINADNITSGVLAITRGGTGANLGLAGDIGGLIYKASNSSLDITTALTGILKANGSSAPTAITGTQNYITKWTNTSTIGTSLIYDDGTSVTLLSNSTLTVTGNAFSVGGSTFVVQSGRVGIGTNSPSYTFDLTGDGRFLGYVGINTVPSSSFRLNVNGNAYFSSGITASSGTFTTGLKVSNFTSSGFVKNDSSGNLIGGQSITASDIPTSNLISGTGITMTGTLTNRLVGAGSNVTISLTGQALALHNLNTDGIITRTGSATVAARTITAGSTKISITNGNGVNGNPTIDINEGDLSLNNIGGTLSVGKGGTGNTSFTSNRPIIYDGSKLASFSGFNGSFIVAKSTNSAEGCMQLNFQYGILTSTATANCP